MEKKRAEVESITSKGKAKSKVKKTTSKKTSAPTISLSPTVLPECKSKGKSKSSVSLTTKGKSKKDASGEVTPRWCPFTSEGVSDRSDRKLKTKAKSKSSSSPFSELENNFGEDPGTKLIFLSTDATMCIQPNGSDIIVDFCRFDDESIFTLDRYGRLHGVSWGKCVVGSTGSVVLSDCYDCDAVFSYDEETLMIRSYGDPTKVITRQGNDVFMADEIIESDCSTSPPETRFGRQSDEPVEQLWSSVSIDTIKLPTSSPYPTETKHPTRTATPTTPAPTAAPTLTPTNTKTRMSDLNIHEALDVYFEDEAAAIFEYGKIENWDISEIRYMFALFENQEDFNGDISGWDTSMIIYASSNFKGATSFNADISSWDMSSNQNFASMFEKAVSFNADISSWDVSLGANFDQMFRDTQEFDIDLSPWEPKSALYLNQMFFDAYGFTQEICWDIDIQSVVTTQMFNGSSGQFICR